MLQNCYRIEDAGVLLCCVVWLGNGVQKFGGTYLHLWSYDSLITLKMEVVSLFETSRRNCRTTRPNTALDSILNNHSVETSMLLRLY